MSSARAGWYVDPSTGTNLRYWSGTTWTDEVAPLPHEPVHSGPVDLFAAAAQAAESETATAEVPATITAVEAPGLDLVEIEPEPAEIEPALVETEPEQLETVPEWEPARSEPKPTEAATAPAKVAAEPEPAGNEPAAEAVPLPELDPEVEQTQLTRRELRARRGGAHPEPDDTPKHLPPMTPPVAAPMDATPEPVEEVEIPAQEPVAPLEIETQEDPVERRRRIVRLSVLLGILAVTSSVAVLTAGTL